MHAAAIPWKEPGQPKPNEITPRRPRPPPPSLRGNTFGSAKAPRDKHCETANLPENSRRPQGAMPANKRRTAMPTVALTRPPISLRCPAATARAQVCAADRSGAVRPTTVRPTRPACRYRPAIASPVSALRCPGNNPRRNGPVAELRRRPRPNLAAGAHLRHTPACHDPCRPAPGRCPCRAHACHGRAGPRRVARARPDEQRRPDARPHRDRCCDPRRCAGHPQGQCRGHGGGRCQGSRAVNAGPSRA